MRRRRAARQEYDMDGYEGMPYGLGEVTNQAEALDDNRPAMAQLWLPDPGERRGWSLYHVWRAEQQTRHQYNLRSGRG